jgi:hypothetical protein
MPFVGLVHSRGWEPPDDVPEPPRRRRPRVPWRPLAWILAWWAVLALVPMADRLFGPVVGYAFLLLVVAVGLWRLERWCGRQYWRGLRDYQA